MSFRNLALVCHLLGRPGINSYTRASAGYEPRVGDR